MPRLGREPNPPAHRNPATGTPARHNPPTTEQLIRARRLANIVAVLAIGSLAGVLIWTKLKLVSPIPRHALADPPPGELPSASRQRTIRPPGHTPPREIPVAPDLVFVIESPHGP